MKRDSLGRFVKGSHHSPKTEFKKGVSPWNKGVPMPKGKNSPSWKGGKRKHAKGYIMIYKPNHPQADQNNLVMEHRLVMEKKLERYLTKKERVHHINGVRDDNRPENLTLYKSHTKHMKLHSKTRKRDEFGRFV